MQGDILVSQQMARFGGPFLFCKSPTSKGLPMIRKFIAIAALCLAGVMAAAMPATAAPFDDVCVLDLSQPATVDYALGAPHGDRCPAVVADVQASPRSLRGAQGEPAPDLCNIAISTLPSPAYRHEDPGRCLVSPLNFVGRSGARPVHPTRAMHTFDEQVRFAEF